MIYLASSSPRRRALMRKILPGRFRVLHPRHAEKRDPRIPLRRWLSRCALDKARSVAGRLSRGIVVAADTVVVTGNRVLGKPGNASNATRMLQQINGKSVRVLSAVAVVDAATGKTSRAIATTRLTMRKCSDAEIQRYVRTGEPLDKAGAIGIQGKGAAFVRSIRGDYFNVVGLPLPLLVRLLRCFGVVVRRFSPYRKSFA